MMRISVVCWSRAKDEEILLNFLQSLEKQTFTDFDVNIVCDRGFDQKTESEFLWFFQSQQLSILQRTQFFTNLNSEFNPNHAGGASYVRNLGIQKAKGEFILLLDDDDIIDENFLRNCLGKREMQTKETKTECIILPTLYFRDSNQIQNQWFSKFNYLQSRPVLNLLWDKQKWQIQMFSWNWIFGLTKTLKQSKYDEKIARISEDLDYTLSLYEKGIQLRVFSDLIVKHFEREKTKLEQARVGSYSQAKQKSRNRFLFVNKHWNRSQIIQFYICWLPGCLVRLSSKIIIFGGKSKRKIIQWLFAGVKEWWKLIHS